MPNTDQAEQPSTATRRYDYAAYPIPFSYLTLPTMAPVQHRWPDKNPGNHYHHLLEQATPVIIAKYGLRDAHPGRIPLTPRPLLLLLVLFVRRLMAHEPDLIVIILDCLTPYIDEIPIIRPIRLLFLPAYRHIQQLVSELPEEWCDLDVRRQTIALCERMGPERAEHIRHGIVMPDPNICHIVRVTPNTFHLRVLSSVPVGVYPLRMRVMFEEYDAHSTTLQERRDYYMKLESCIRGSVVPYFHNDMTRVAQEAGFPKKVANNMGRLIYVASCLFAYKNPKDPDTWSEVKKEQGIYSKILQVQRR